MGLPFLSFDGHGLYFLGGGGGTGLELRAYSLHLEPLHQPFFMLGIFEIGSHELFPWAGFESVFLISTS
jgi:hypothetical protein